MPLVNVDRVDRDGNVADRARQNPQNHNQFEHDVVVEVHLHLLWHRRAPWHLVRRGWNVIEPWLAWLHGGWAGACY